MKPEEVYILDENSKWIGIEPKILMENAGKGVAKKLLENTNKNELNEIGVFCGTGNNGGDGFVAARHLSSYSNVSLFVFGKPSSMSTIARENFEILKKIPSIKIKEIKDSTNLEDIEFDFNVILDALLGVGIRGEPREPMKTAVKKINQTKTDSKIISVDVPTGFGSNLKVDADLSVTFHAQKKKQKEAEVIDIGIPKDLEHIVGPGDVKSINTRNKGSHKGQNGRLMIIGGSQNYHGAPLLSSEIASKFVDLVYLASTREVIAKSEKDIIPIRLNNDYFTLKDSNRILNKISNLNIDTVLIGPGIGERKKTLKAISNLIEKIKIPVVLDADALKIQKISEKLSKEDIITPHQQELNRILNKEIKYPKEIKEKGNKVKKISKKLGTTIILKGKNDFISDGIKWKFNRTGNAGMTTGGTGDVLSGLVAALRTKNNPFKSATSATFLNGYTGDKLYKDKGDIFTASELIEPISKSYKEIKDY